MEHLTFPIRGDRLSMTVAVGSRLCSLQSAYQRIEVYDSELFGRLLLLDGHIQLAESDEHAYHELLVQLPLLSLPQASSALVVGGGDGGALRELCRRPGLRKIEIVEIDAAVIETCARFLPGVSAGAFQDPRVVLTVEDAFAFVKRRRGEFDFIVLDSTDTYEGEDGALSEALFTREFFGDCLAALRPGGLVVTQADNPVFCPYSREAVRAAFAEVFPASGDYFGLVPSFGGYSAFVWGGRDAAPAPVWPGSDLEFRYLTPATYALALAGVAF